MHIKVWKIKKNSRMFFLFFACRGPLFWFFVRKLQRNPNIRLEKIVFTLVTARCEHSNTAHVSHIILCTSLTATEYHIYTILHTIVTFMTLFTHVRVTFMGKYGCDYWRKTHYPDDSCNIFKRAKHYFSRSTRRFPRIQMRTRDKYNALLPRPNSTRYCLCFCFIIFQIDKTKQNTASRNYYRFREIETLTWRGKIRVSGFVFVFFFFPLPQKHTTRL